MAEDKKSTKILIRDRATVLTLKVRKLYVKRRP